MRPRTIAIFLLCFLLTIMPLLAQDQKPFEFQFFADLQAYINRIKAADAQEAQAMVDALWQSLTSTQQIPFTRDDQVAFLYRGKAESVQWVADVTGWNPVPEAEGRRVGQTDLWILEEHLPVTARVEYRIRVDGADDWILDPANPQVVDSGPHPNSELRMPLYTVTTVTEAREDVTPGTVSQQQMIESKSMGYTLGYWVYTPQAYADLKDLPVIYVLDGNDFLDVRMGSLVPALDNMIFDGRIVPVMAVFINARDPANPEVNRRETEFLDNPNYARFVVEELIPLIEASYRTDPEARAILGVSFGGVGAAYIAGLYPQIFAMVAALSPSTWASKEITALYQDAQVLPKRYFIGTGYPLWDNFLPQSSLDMLTSKGVELTYLSTVEAHSWGTWRGLLDEMLTSFYGIRLMEAEASA